jgi:hypothetical protein
MSKETYEGFKNKETFDLDFHFEEGFYFLKDEAGETTLEELTSRIKDYATEHFENKFRQDEKNGNFDRMVYNLTQNFLQQVDWKDIAEKYIDME